MNVNALKGRKLDYWVAKADDWDENTCRITLRARTAMQYEKRGDYVLEILAREHISLTPNHAGDEARPKGNNNWLAAIEHPARGLAQAIGRTPAQAVLRCFVASRFGDEIEDVR